MKGFINSATKEFLVKVKKEDVKKEAKRRGLDIYFTVYANEDKYGYLKGQLKAFDAFFFFVATNESEKIVVQRQDYEFVLNNVVNLGMISMFVNMHRLPFIPTLNTSNFAELSDIPGK